MVNQVLRIKAKLDIEKLKLNTLKSRQKKKVLTPTFGEQCETTEGQWVKLEGG